MEYVYEVERDDKLAKWLENTKYKFEIKENKIIIKFEDFYEIYKFEKFVKAVKAGFDIKLCEKILYEDWDIYEIDLKKVSEKKINHMIRIKGRIIGEKGKALKEIMERTGAYIIVTDRFVYLLGDNISLPSAYEAIKKIIKGSSHSKAFDYATFYKKNLENKEKEIKYKENIL